MEKQVWIIAGILTGVLCAGLLGVSYWNKTRELDQAQADLAGAQQTAARAQADSDALRQKTVAATARIAALEKEKASVVQQHQSLEDELRAALQSKDVTISQLQGRLTVNILDRILFDSGEADLKPDGAAVLGQVATVLAQHPQVKIHVIGHTDNVPIRASARSRFPSNWELSTARATAAVRYLTEKAGVDPRRLGAVGYGEFRPIAENSTPEGRARNRRIAITILSEELAGSDVIPAVATNTPAISDPGTNAPAVATNTPATAAPSLDKLPPPKD